MRNYTNDKRPWQTKPSGYRHCKLDRLLEFKKGCILPPPMKGDLGNAKN